MAVFVIFLYLDCDEVAIWGGVNKILPHGGRGPQSGVGGIKVLCQSFNITKQPEYPPRLAPASQSTPPWVGNFALNQDLKILPQRGECRRQPEGGIGGCHSYKLKSTLSS